MMLDLPVSFEHVQQKSIGLLNLLFVNYVSNVNAPALRYTDLELQVCQSCSKWGCYLHVIVFEHIK